jgi:hypothetical protein
VKEVGIKDDVEDLIRHQMLAVKMEEGVVEGAGKMTMVGVIADDEGGCLHKTLNGREAGVPQPDLKRILVMMKRGFEWARHYFWGERVLSVQRYQSYRMVEVEGQARHCFHCC